jgi:hypothetical protein
LVVIVPSLSFVGWAIETTCTSPSIPVAFYAQPRAFFLLECFSCFTMLDEIRNVLQQLGGAESQRNHT